MIPCILIVDDERDFLYPQRDIIKRYGFQARYTKKLDWIESVIKSTEINCIHLDILLDPHATVPDWKKKTGLSEVSRVLQKYGKRIPIMILSGYIDDKAKQMADEYSISDLIMKWYNKPVDYEKVVLDTIKVINEREFKQTKELILDYIQVSDNESVKFFEKTLKALPTLKNYVELDPKHLLKRLRQLSNKIRVELKDSNGEKFREADARNFTEIVLDHVCDYFRYATNNHLVLAEYFVDAIERVKTEDEALRTETAWELMREIIDLLRKEKLHDEEVYFARNKLEQILGVPMGLRFSKLEKLDTYSGNEIIGDGCNGA